MVGKKNKSIHPEIKNFWENKCFKLEERNFNSINDSLHKTFIIRFGLLSQKIVAISNDISKIDNSESIIYKYYYDFDNLCSPGLLEKDMLRVVRLKAFL